MHTETELPSSDKPTTKPVIVAQDLCHDITSSGLNVRLLDNLNIQVNRGESVAIVGSSGCGKTTLLGLLAGLDRTQAKRIELLGQDMQAMDEDQRAALRAGRIGFVYQSFQLLPELTALENVMLPLELSDDISNNTEAKNRAMQALKSVGLSERTSHRPKQLSGGEQQRVALARAFAPQPTVLFADEPTGNLDDQTGEQIADLLFAMNKNHQTTMLLVTHDTELAQRCDRQLRLVQGQLTELSG